MIRFSFLSLVRTTVLPALLAIGVVDAAAQVSDCPRTLGDPLYCTECGPCSEGEGGCRGDDQCAEGLSCAEDFGAIFDLPRTVDVCVTPRGYPLPAYSVLELPTLGALPVIEAQALNNAGQVTGSATAIEDGDPRTVAFLFSPQDGMKELDPLGDQRTRAFRINEAGDVFGALFDAAGTRQSGVFLYRPESGFDFLEEGSNGLVRQTFEIFDMNEAGDLVGSIERRDGLRVPYLYLAGDGWTDLSALDPRLAGNSGLAVHINEAGDITLAVRPRGTQRIVTFLLHGGQLIELSDEFTIPTALNDNGRVVGVAGSDALERHTFLVPRPGRRLRDIHPRRFSSSSPIVLTAKGVVGGVISTTTSLRDILFTWDERRAPKMKLLVRRVDFTALLVERLRLFFNLGGVLANERLEFAGTMRSFNFVGQLGEDHFYFGVPYGLYNVGTLLRDAGFEGTVAEILDLNDRGAMLLRVERGEDETATVVLAP